MKPTKGISWIIVDDRYILIISKNWKADTFIACRADMIIIDREIFKLNKSKFIGNALQSKIIFWDELKDIGTLF